jgi:acyl phosphate:glycerol-3-phosphate acyltransferase
MDILLWTLIGFFSGSIPFSILLGRLARKGDIRQYGDHNPGGTNVLRAAGWRWGLAALVLDGLKGAVPVGLAWFWIGINGWGIVPVALAPLFGHAFSPWLGGKGGKAVATTFGIWTGLTLGVGPTVLGLLLGLSYAVFESNGWASFLTVGVFGGFVWGFYSDTYPAWMWVWLGNLALIGWKHRAELVAWPVLRPSLMRRLVKQRD